MSLSSYLSFLSFLSFLPSFFPIFLSFLLSFFPSFLLSFCQVLVAAGRLLSCSMWDLVPRPGIKPGPPALGAWSLNHWTTREVPPFVSLNELMPVVYCRVANSFLSLTIWLCGLWTAALRMMVKQTRKYAVLVSRVCHGPGSGEGQDSKVLLWMHARREGLLCPSLLELRPESSAWRDVGQTWIDL